MKIGVWLKLLIRVIYLLLIMEQLLAHLKFISIDIVNKALNLIVYPLAEFLLLSLDLQILKIYSILCGTVCQHEKQKNPVE